MSFKKLKKQISKQNLPVVVASSKPDSLGEKDTDPLKRNCQPIATAEVDKKEEASKPGSHWN